MKNILLTGLPGTGKTTLVERLIERLGDLEPAGFLTREIRQGGSRAGFSLQVIGGPAMTLAHVDFGGKFRVSRYGVDVEGFEAMLERIDLGSSESNLVIIDEIGKMECFSKLFRRTVEGLLAGDKVLCATVAMKGGGFPAAVRSRKDCSVFEVTRENRSGLDGILEKKIRERL